MIKLFKKMVNTLRGGSKKDWVEFRSDYWSREHINERLFVPIEHYTDAAKADIERELATKIGETLLKRNLLFFSAHEEFPDNGDVYIDCSVNVLKPKQRTSMLMPPHLVIKKRRRADE